MNQSEQFLVKQHAKYLKALSHKLLGTGVMFHILFKSDENNAQESFFFMNMFHMSLSLETKMFRRETWRFELLVMFCIVLETGKLNSNNRVCFYIYYTWFSF